MLSIIRSSRLLCQSSAELIHDGAVVINGNRIEDVGPWESIKTKWQDALVTNLGDVTLMPGLFDCHVHLQMDPSGTNTSTDITLHDDELLPLMQRNALKLLDAGVTTARDLGARGMTAITLREMIKDGTIPGPRLQCANAPLTVAGGHAHSMGGVCEGIEGVRAEVRKRAAEGANLIKVMATGGFMTAGSHPSKARFSQAEMDAIADEAKKAGLPVTTHATGTEGIERAAEARFNSIEHCAWISSDGKAVFDKAVARKLVEHDIAVCPTMNTACVESDYFCPWDSRNVIVSNLSLLRESGVRIIVGTDAGIGFCPFERYADGLTVLADAGYTPREIIAAATTVAAKECNLETECGKIEPGFAADLVAFVGNPLEDIKCIAKPCFVMAAGRRHDLTPIAPKEEFDAPNPVIERNPVAEFIANATAMGVDVCGVIPDDAVKVIGYQYAAEPVSKAWVWIRVQIDLLNTEDTRHKIEKRQGWANIGNGMFAQDWCKSNDRAGWFDNVIYGYICYVDLNMYSVGISYRGLRSNERLDFSKLSGNDCGATCLYSAGQNTPTGCFDS